MTRYTILIALSFAFVTNAQAQSVRRFHQSIEVPEQQALTLAPLSDAEVEVVQWEGSDILIEITVRSNTGSAAVLNHLQKEGRYDLVISTESGKPWLARKQVKRQVVKAKGVDMDEKVLYKISVPTSVRLLRPTGESYSNTEK